MNKYLKSFFLGLIFAAAIPGTSFAATCSLEGTTIIYVNGILTTDAGAKLDKDAIETRYEKSFSTKNVTFDNIHNPSHFEGASDLLKSVEQAHWSDTVVQDVDLKTMLKELHKKLKTQKVLLVGHSQGGFYVNQIYNHLVHNGIPKSAIAVYHTATPAHYVANEGRYITSETDEVIQTVRKWVKRSPLNANEPLLPNLSIKLSPEDKRQSWAGHSLSDIYLKRAGTLIAKDMQQLLLGLRASNVQPAVQESGGCFVPPGFVLSDVSDMAMHAVADPLVSWGRSLASKALGEAWDTTVAAVPLLKILEARDQEEFVRIGFPMVKSIYGSSLGVEEAAALVTEAEIKAFEKAPDFVVNELFADQRKDEAKKTLPETIADVQGDALDTGEPELVVEPATEPVAEPTVDADLVAVEAPPALVQEKSEPGIDTAATPGGIQPLAFGSGLGGGGGSSSSNSSGAAAAAPAAVTDTTAPDAPVITSPAFSAVQTAAFTVQGTAEEEVTVTLTFVNQSGDTETSTTTATGGVWEFADVLPQEGDTELLLTATDAAGNESAETIQLVAVDTIAPAVSVTVDKCADSISVEVCLLLAGGDLLVEWEVTADDLSYYTYQGATTTATSTAATIADGETKTFTIEAFDTNGNTASESVTVLTESLPVVVNEIAWHGTVANEAHEWIELHNRTAYAIDLTDWTITTEQENVDITLGGTIGANDYFVVSNGAVGNIGADSEVDWAVRLDNDGRTLTLADAGGGAIDVVEECTFKWCGGKKTAKSMERISASETNDASNWTTNDTYTKNGTDSDGNDVLGTPGAANSITRRLSSVSTNTTLNANNSPYLVLSDITIASGATLTVPAGVVLKIVDEASITVEGTLITEGAEGAEVVFTSFADDAHGGDTNGDGSTTAPVAGAWRMIALADGATATMAHTKVLYAGTRRSGQSSHGAVYVQDGAILTVQNITVANAKEEGVYAEEGASLFIANATFENNEDAAKGYGVYAQTTDGDTIEITNSTFDNNGRAGAVVGGTGNFTVTGNTFTNNNYALSIAHFFGEVSGNSGSSNTVNGILLPGALGTDGKIATLTANDLPFIFNADVTVPSGAVVRITQGVVVKAEGEKVFTVDGGTVELQGATAGDITFTTNSVVKEAGAWDGIVVQNGGALTGEGLLLEYAGADQFVSTDGRGLLVQGAASIVTLANSSFSDNKQVGVRIDDGTITFTDGTIQNHTEARTGDAVGLKVTGGTNTFTNIIFINNTLDTAPTDLIP